jgi:hypothetical protein
VADWGGDLDRWLAPFLARLGHKARRRMCPLYVAGLIGPGDRKSVEPMASRWAPGDYDQLHHFISSGVWNEALLEEELAIQADKLIGGASAVLVVDDTALPKKGSHSVGVAPQYASALGKTANCQTLVSLTMRSDTLGREQTTARILLHGPTAGLRFQPSRPAPSLPHQVPNEHVENAGTRKPRHPKSFRP